MYYQHTLSLFHLPVINQPVKYGSCLLHMWEKTNDLTTNSRYFGCIKTVEPIAMCTCTYQAFHTVHAISFRQSWMYVWSHEVKIGEDGVVGKWKFERECWGCFAAWMTHALSLVPRLRGRRETTWYWLLAHVQSFPKNLGIHLNYILKLQHVYVQYIFVSLKDLAIRDTYMILIKLSVSLYKCVS